MGNAKASKQLDEVFHALADGTRREILKSIAQKECTVTELAAPHAMSLAAVSKHLKVLERAGLLERTIDGRVHRCGINVEPLEGVSGVVREYQAFWSDRFDALEKFLEESGKKKEGSA